MNDTTNNKDILTKEIGRRVRELREFHSFTREQLAENADISVQFLAAIETGQKSMTTHTLYKLSKALHISTDYLLFGEDTVHNNAGKINLLLESLSEDERSIAEHLLQTYMNALSKREHNVMKKFNIT